MSKKTKYISIAKMLPNAITISSLCFGLLAVYYSFTYHWEKACFLIILASIFDILDGRFARMLNVMTDFGANLDSLCDFANYTIFPALIIFNWSLYSDGMHGWYAVMISACCGAIRLARFNTEDKLIDHPVKKCFFQGIPSPAGGILILLPLIIQNGFGEDASLSLQNSSFYTHEVYISIVALCMVGTFPTLSLKYVKFPKRHMPLALVMFALVLLSLAVFKWKVLAIYCIIYILSIPFAWFRYQSMMGNNILTPPKL